MIELCNIQKTYRVARRDAGFSQALKALFHKQYTIVHALRDLSFSIQDGEMVGYIGPNGAGKSSTVKVISGILTPDSGSCLIDGRVPWKERAAHVANIGVVFGQRSQLWWDVPVADSLELLRDIYRVPEDQYRRTLSELTERLALDQLLRTPTRQLSLGQRMRCEIAAALIHSPRVLFLDEPTIGLDAVSKIAVREFIREQNREKGTTVILTTHDMQDVEALTNRILLIGKGRILLDGQLEELKSRYAAQKTLSLSYQGELCSLFPGLTLKEQQPGRAVLLLDTAQVPVSEAIARLSASLALTDFAVQDPSAEELVLKLYDTFHIAEEPKGRKEADAG